MCGVRWTHFTSSFDICEGLEQSHGPESPNRKDRSLCRSDAADYLVYISQGAVLLAMGTQVARPPPPGWAADGIGWGMTDCKYAQRGRREQVSLKREEKMNQFSQH